MTLKEELTNNVKSFNYGVVNQEEYKKELRELYEELREHSKYGNTFLHDVHFGMNYPYLCNSKIFNAFLNDIKKEGIDVKYEYRNRLGCDITFSWK